MLYMVLYMVATPIGNLEDITFRALRILKEVDLIAVEDTRHTRKLLSHYKFSNKLLIYNDAKKEKATPNLIKMLKQGVSIAVVSDAGTPGISDPGFYLVREATKQGIKVVPVPGANSLLAALVASGLPTDKFSFYGFLPKKEKAKNDFFQNIKDKTETIIVYESPYRVIKTLNLMIEIIPDHNIVVARELTKKFEEFVRGKPKKVLAHFEKKKIKGEFVILLKNSFKNMF